MNVNYKMGDTVLGTTVKEKDLGVTISADMKVSEQCGIAASKGNQILGLIRRNITYKGKKLIIPLYKAIVRPHLEYCIQASALRGPGFWSKPGPARSPRAGPGRAGPLHNLAGRAGPGPTYCGPGPGLG